MSSEERIADLKDLLELHADGVAVCWPNGLTPDGASKIVQTHAWRQKYNAAGKREVVQKQPLESEKSSKSSSAPCEDDDDDEDPLVEAFRCPITQLKIKEPLMTPSGHSYEAHAIRKVAQERGSSPMTNKRLRVYDLVPNRSLKDAMDQVGKSQQTPQVKPQVKPQAEPQAECNMSRVQEQVRILAAKLREAEGRVNAAEIREKNAEAKVEESVAAATRKLMDTQNALVGKLKVVASKLREVEAAKEEWRQKADGLAREVEAAKQNWRQQSENARRAEANPVAKRPRASGAGAQAHQANPVAKRPRASGADAQAHQEEPCQATPPRPPLPLIDDSTVRKRRISFSPQPEPVPAKANATSRAEPAAAKAKACQRRQSLALDPAPVPAKAKAKATPKPAAAKAKGRPSTMDAPVTRGRSRKSTSFF